MEFGAVPQNLLWLPTASISLDQSSDFSEQVQTSRSRPCALAPSPHEKCARSRQGPHHNFRFFGNFYLALGEPTLTQNESKSSKSCQPSEVICACPWRNEQTSPVRPGRRAHGDRDSRTCRKADDLARILAVAAISSVCCCNGARIHINLIAERGCPVDPGRLVSRTRGRTASGGRTLCDYNPGWQLPITVLAMLGIFPITLS